MNPNVFNTFPLLESSRLLFQNMATADPQEVFIMRSDSQIYKYLDRPMAQSIDDAIKHIDLLKNSFAEHTAISWLLVERSTMKVAGYIGLWRFVIENNRAEIGYVLKHEFWGKGLMKEAIDAVVRFAFSPMEFHSIMANVNPANIQSIKVLEKCNFKKEACFREDYFYNGAYLDTLIFGLLEKDIQ